jgi:predicted permease
MAQALLIASIRNAARQFWKSRGFTAAAVVTLALGIGGTTAIFTLIDAVMLRPLPVSDPARLYRIGDGDDTIAVGRHGGWGFFPFPLYERLKAGAPEFEDITAFDWGGNQLSVRRQGTAAAARPLLAEYATGTYFSTLGIGAFSGRVFTPDDDRPSAPPVAVLSHRAWQGIYGADASIVGTTLVVQGHPFTVIGVAAPGFFGEVIRAYAPDMWIPLQQEPMIAGGGSMLHQSTESWLVVIGRLRRDASIDGMAARLTEILRQWIQYESEYPGNRMPDILRDLPRQTVAVVPAGAGIGLGGLSLKEQYGPSLQILLAICGLVLVIACANVANLLLARSVARRAQTAVRLAIGATRRQIVGEALAESVLLAVAGGLAGLLVAIAAARLLVALAFRDSQFVPIATTPSLVVLAAALALSLATGVVFGAAPAWFQTRTDAIAALRGSARGAGHRSSRARAALLILQATLSVVLVAASTMLARSLANLEHQDFGYPVQGRVTVGLNRLPSTYTPQQLSTLYRDVEQRLANLPGVRGAGLALYNPLTSNWGETILVAGHPPHTSNESGASWDRVSADYLQDLGVTIVRGRFFTAADNETTVPVAVVNEAFVKRFFKDNEDPLDQHFGVELPENAATFRIVGIVRDAKFSRTGLNQPARPMFFVPLAQRVDYKTDRRRMIEGLSHLIQGIMLVTDSSPGDLEPPLRRTLAEADPNLTITEARTIKQQIEITFDRERAVASLAQVFGIVALVLAAVGVYGVTAYTVAQQTNEIGIRMALGAAPLKVMQWVLRRAFQRVAVGLVVGLPLAVGAGRFMVAQLYGVSFWDLFALTVGAGSLVVCAFVAAIIPAGRAAAISPMNALRTD